MNPPKIHVGVLVKTELGVDHRKLFSKVTFSGSHEASILAVANKKVEIASTNLPDYRPHHLARALDFVARSRDTVPLAELVNREVPLEGIDEAFAHAAARRGVRTAIVP